MSSTTQISYSKPSLAMEQEKKLEYQTFIQETVSSFLRSVYGFVNTGNTFYALPPSTTTRITYFILGGVNEAVRALAQIEKRRVKLNTVMRHNAIICVRSDESQPVHALLESGKDKGKITIIFEGIFDPRATNLNGWTKDDLISFVITENLVTPTKAARLDREGLVEQIKYLFSSETPQEDNEIGNRLVVIYDKLADEPNVMEGFTHEEREELIETLSEYRDEMFSSDQLLRINKIMDLAEMTAIDQDTYDTIMEVLNGLLKAMEDQE